MLYCHGKYTEMAKLKAVVLPGKTGIDGKTNIKIRLTHDKKSREIRTPHYINPKFMGRDGIIKQTYPSHEKLNMALNLILSEYNGILEGIGKDIIYMDINTIANKLRRHDGTGEGIIRYMEERIKILRLEKRHSYADTYHATIKHLRVFAGKNEILFKEINLDFLHRFERHLLKEKKINTARIYLNNIRAVFNHAIDNDIIRQELFPFRKFLVKKEQTTKRNLSIEQIQKLLVQDLTPARQKAMDLFMLSFYLQGMNFKDMLFLTAKNVSKGRIIYKRYKTGSELSVKIQPESGVILAKYRGERYLLQCMDQMNNKRKTLAYKDIK